MSHAIRMMLIAGLAITAAGWHAEAHADSADAIPDRVRIETSHGTIDVELFSTEAPRTTENFLTLIDSGFYEGLVFHRVIANFMIQTGGYDAQMNYREPPGTVPNESFNGLRNRTGTLAMARMEDPDSADAQFFINVNDNAHLDAAPGRPGYTVFGRVIAGMDVVHDIELADTGIRAGMAAVPDSPIRILKAARLR